MANNDKKMNLRGSISVAPLGSVATLEQENLELYTQNFTYLAKGSVTLALGANHSITFADYGMADPVDFCHISVRDNVTGLPKTAQITLAASGTAQGGIAATGSSQIVASDLIWVAYDYQDCNVVTILNQTAGGTIEVNWLAGSN